MKKFKALVFLAVTLALVILAPATSIQGESHPVPIPFNLPLRFERLAVEDGLPHATVLGAIQDRAGFMWFATQDGLSRYDGHTFTTFRHDIDNPNSLSNNNTFGIIESKDGLIWVGTDPGGLNVYDPATGKFKVYVHDENDPASLINNSVWSLLEDNQGRIWVGTFNGLSRLDRATGKFTNYPYAPDRPRALAGSTIYRIYQDKTGTIWLGTRSGLHRYDPQTDDFTVFKNNPNDPISISSNNVWTIREDSRGNFWVGTRRGGLARFDRKAGTFTAFRYRSTDPTSLSDDNIWSVFEDSAGNLWVTTENGGINLFDPSTEKFSRYQYNPGDPYSISNNDIYWVTEDRSGVVWFTSRYGGVNKLSPSMQRFGLYRSIPGNPNSLTSSNVYSALADGNVVWVGTFGGGLNRIDRKTGQVTAYQFNPNNPKSISNDKVYSLFRDANNVLWIATSGGGLNRRDPITGEFTVYRYTDAQPDVITSNFLTNIESAGTGRLWIGTLGYGLDLFDTVKGKLLKEYAHDPKNPNSLTEDTVYDLAVDAAGKVWIATARGGLELLDPQTDQFTHHLHDPKNTNSILADTVQSVFIDKARNMVWAGTSDGLSGLELASGKWFNYTIADGLPNNTIVGIEGDRHGNLWISTSKGISQFNPDRKTFVNYNARDGLQGDQFEIASSSSGEDGYLYFGGSAGLTWFNPDSIVPNNYLPPVVFTGFMLFNRPVQAPSELLPRPIEQIKQLGLRHDQSVFTLKFAALNYQAPSKNLYQYKMEGFDLDWSPPRTNSEVTYTNLSPGTYTFMVRASNNDGLFNQTPAQLTIQIEPPWWETWWFRVGIVLASTVAVVGYFNLRIRAIRAANHALELRVVERTRELQQAEQLLKAANTELKCQLDEITLLEQRVREQSIRDALTGLHNRHYLPDRLDAEFSLAQRHDHLIAFALIDIDHFKNINDTFGHQAGDVALKSVAQTILTHIRKSDIACRYGGEEFLVVMPNIPPEDAAHRIEQIRANIQALVVLHDGRKIQMTVSIGWVVYPQHGKDSDEILSQVDRALYQAKESGRNRIVVF